MIFLTSIFVNLDVELDVNLRQSIRQSSSIWTLNWTSISVNLDVIFRPLILEAQEFGREVYSVFTFLVKSVFFKDMVSR